MTDIKVMFVYGSPHKPLTARRRDNLGVAQLSAMLKQRGIIPRLHFIFDWTNDEMLRFAGVIDNECIDVVCFSVICIETFGDILPFMEIARDMGRTVILGGSHIKFIRKPIDTPAHYICRGDGETLPDFFLKGDTALFDSPMVTEDIHNLPLPDYDLMLPYLQTDGDPESFMLPYITSRNCPWECSFCGQSLVPDKKLFVRARVKEDLTALAIKYPGRIYEVRFGDGTMPYYSKAWRESWGGINIPFSGCIRADIEPRLLNWLCDRGLTRVIIGVEDPDEEYRNKVFNKQITDGDIYRTVRMLHKRGVDAELSFIYGAPGQAEDTREKAIAMVEKITRDSLIRIDEDTFYGSLTEVHFFGYGDEAGLRELA